MKLLSIIKTIWGPSQEWEPCPLDSLTMRREINGKVEYRPATEEEEKEAVEWQAHGF